MSLDWENIAHVRVHARAAERSIVELEAENARLLAMVEQVTALEQEMRRCVHAEADSVQYFAYRLKLVLARGTEQP